jgi:hypothetical protein
VGLENLTADLAGNDCRLVAEVPVLAANYRQKKHVAIRKSATPLALP